MLAGPTVPLPLTPELTQSVKEVEIKETSTGGSGFQIVLQAGRGPLAIIDYPELVDQRLQPGSRVILTLTLGVVPHVLVDGLITHRQVNPSTVPGESTVVLTGVDVSVAMDREEKNVEHPAQPEFAIVAKILLTYAQYGLIPVVIPPLTIDVPLPTDRIPVQLSTDLAYIQTLADRFDHVFHITPGPLPGTNTAYWGPPIRIGVPQPALTVNMGPETNVTELQFVEDGAGATEVAGTVQDRTTNAQIPVRSIPISKRPPLAAFPTRLANPLTRLAAYRAEGGRTATQAMGEAQAQADASTDTVTGTGTLDGAKYQGLLRPRGLVGVRGVGYRYDGIYEVRDTTTKITLGSIKQSFTIVREGVGSTVSMVRP